MSTQLLSDYGFKNIVLDNWGLCEVAVGKYVGRDGVILATYRVIHKESGREKIYMSNLPVSEDEQAIKHIYMLGYRILLDADEYPENCFVHDTTDVAVNLLGHTKAMTKVIELMRRDMSLSHWRKIEQAYEALMLRIKSERISELETAMRESVYDTIANELDWPDFLRVVELVVGNTGDLQELRKLVNDVYGLDELED